MTTSFWGIEGYTTKWENGRPLEARVHANGEGDNDYLTIEEAFIDWLRGEGNIEETGYVVIGRRAIPRSNKMRGKNLVRGDISCAEETAYDDAGNEYYFWACDAIYEAPERAERRDDEEEVASRIGEQIIRAQTTGQTTNIKFAKAYVDGVGEIVDGAKRLVGWSGGDPGEQTIDGVDMPIPSLQFTITTYVAADAITPAFERRLALYTGAVNSVAWRGFNPGESRFEGASWNYVLDADETEAAELVHQINCMPNMAAMPFTIWNPASPNTPQNVTLAKRGWDVVSTPTRTREVAGADISLDLPVAVYAQRVSDYIDFRVLWP